MVDMANPHLFYVSSNCRADAAGGGAIGSTRAPTTSRTCRSVLRVMVVMVVMMYLPCILRILYVLLQRRECLLGRCQITRRECTCKVVVIG
jgi:hypothetical protein